jgi:hypothetical protein
VNEDALGLLLRARGHEMSDELRDRVRAASMRVDTIAVVGLFASIGIALAAAMFVPLPATALTLLTLVSCGGAYLGLNAWKKRLATSLAAEIEQRLDRFLLESAGAAGSPVAISLRESER